MSFYLPFALSLLWVGAHVAVPTASACEKEAFEALRTRAAHGPELFQKSTSAPWIPAEEITSLERNMKRNRVRNTGFPLHRGFEHYLHVLRPMGFVPEAMAGLRVLDIGSGFSDFIERLATGYGADTHGIDLAYHPEFGTDGESHGNFPEVVRTLEEKSLAWHRRYGVSATELPFPDHSVDVAVALASLTYLLPYPYSYQKAIAETLRVLKPGGKAYLIDEGVSVPLFLGVEPLLEHWGVPYHRLAGTRNITVTKSVATEGLTPLAPKEFRQASLAYAEALQAPPKPLRHKWKQ